MIHILKKYTLCIQMSNKSLLSHTKRMRSFFSTLPHGNGILKSIQFKFKLGSMVKLTQFDRYIQQNQGDIKKYGKTLILQFVNQFPMIIFDQTEGQIGIQKRQERYRLLKSIFSFLNELEGLNFYELNLRYSIFKKVINLVGPDALIIQKADQDQKQLVNMLENQPVHIIDVMNWLYMLPPNYKQYFSTLAFDLIEKEFQNPQIRQFFSSQKGLPILIQRIFQKDWIKMRKYKNIIRFITYEASIKQYDNLEQLIIQLQRLVKMRFHIIGQKMIPKIIDNIMQKFERQFDELSKNQQAILKVFSVFKHLPLNYNNSFFNKIHNFLKGTKQLPAQLLLYLPYNKLSHRQVTFLQSKMFTIGRDGTAVELMQTIYQPQFKDILTPFIIKEAHNNMLEMWRKQSTGLDYHYDVYIALIFRFSKLKTPIVDRKKMKQIVVKIAKKAEEEGYLFLESLSAVNMVAFLQLCYSHNVKLEESLVTTKMEDVLRDRKQKNTSSMVNQQFMIALKVHYNADHKKSRQLLTFLIHQIANNPQIQLFQKLLLLFLIQKTMRPQPKWAIYSKRLSNQLVKDVDSFAESYITYENRTLKLTNFVFLKLYEEKADFNTLTQLLSSLNLKLVTSLKGKLISPLKKYINQLDLSRFEVEKSFLNSLIQTYRILFYFKNQISQFMEYLSIRLIQMVLQKVKRDQYVNGKQFTSLTIYVMQTIKNIQIQKKTQIIESIVFIIKYLRKKQGIYLKVYELDFLCSNQKYIRINSEVLGHQWTEIVDTLKRTERLDHHKDLFFIIIKLHCRQLAELSSYDLRYFMDRCTEMIDYSMLNLNKIKQCLGYEILSCEDQSQIQKMRLFLSGMVKLCFRKDKKKNSYFIYQYYLQFFSKLKASEMIIQICEQLLCEKLYPVQISNIVPILNNNQIKSSRFSQRILQIMSLSQAYVSFQGMQVLSWLQKISYQLPENNYNLNKLRDKVNVGVIARTNELKLYMRSILNGEQRSIQDGYTLQDMNFDRNYKTFIEYAWFSIKNKDTQTPQFKFICRYLFFGVDRIKARIQNPQQRKLISKVKLYHVIKFIKQSRFFQIDDQKIESSFREQGPLKQKTRKTKVMNKMENQLNLMKIQTCLKLEKKLNKFAGNLQWNFKHQIQAKQMPNRVTVEYYVEQKNQNNKIIIKNNYIIHTVKKYHLTPQLGMEQDQNTDSQAYFQRSNINKNGNKQMTDQIVATPDEDEYIGNMNTLDDLDLQQVSLSIFQDSQHIKQTKQYKRMKQSDIKPQSQINDVKQRLTKGVKSPKKPLFSPSKAKQVNEQKQVSKTKKQFKTILPIQNQEQHLYKDYNGYLKVQKSIIELTSGMKCIIYDPEKDMFLH